jgi:hypothetical protein
MSTDRKKSTRHGLAGHQNRNKKMSKNLILTCALLVATVLASGCSRQPTVPDVQFGETVRNVMESQIHDHEAAIHPNPDAVEGSDPYRLDAALNAHRGDVTEADQVQQPLSINVGR